MQARIDYKSVAPKALEAMLGLEEYLRRSALERPLLELVKTRASQINGCSYCLDMHTKDARAAGETEQRLYGVGAWQDAPYYTERERAALLWTDAITLLTRDFAPDGVYEAVRQHFSEKEMVDLTMAIIAINGWNRLNVGFRTPAGTYQPAPR